MGVIETVTVGTVDAKEKKMYRHVIMWVSLYGGTKDHMCVLP